jgi:hypothetical protein
VEFRTLTDTLLCLEDEFKYLPLWAGGNNDGTGGVFDKEFIAPTLLGANGPGPSYHTGYSSVSEASSRTEMDWDGSSSVAPASSNRVDNGLSGYESSMTFRSDSEDYGNLLGQQQIPIAESSTWQDDASISQSSNGDHNDSLMAQLDLDDGGYSDIMSTSDSDGTLLDWEEESDNEVMSATDNEDAEWGSDEDNL